MQIRQHRFDGFYGSRLSVGIENVDDLLADLDRHWKRLERKTWLPAKRPRGVEKPGFLLHRVDGDQRHIVILISALLIVEQGLQ